MARYLSGRLADIDPNDPWYDTVRIEAARSDRLGRSPEDAT